MKGYIKIKRMDEVYGPFWNMHGPSDVYNAAMRRDNEVPVVRPGDAIAVGSTVYQVPEEITGQGGGYPHLASGPAGEGVVSAWEDTGPIDPHSGRRWGSHGGTGVRERADPEFDIGGGF